MIREQINNKEQISIKIYDDARFFLATGVLSS